MEDASIIQETEEEPLYQQGRYPSVINTDDLVFELGKQLVGSINKEKLLSTLLNKNKSTETAMIEAMKAKAGIEEKVVKLEISNRQYVENNQKLDAELVKIRQDFEGFKQNSQETIKGLETKIVLLNSEHEKSLVEFKNLLGIRAEEIKILKKKKTLKKRG